MARRNASTRIDPLMEQASQALVATRYFDAERLAVEAMALARSVSAFERMARICLPLQEARRQRMSIAFDIAAHREPVASRPRRRRGRDGPARAAGDAIGDRAAAIASTEPAARIVDFAIAETPRVEPGCWLVQPPNVAADARRLRRAAFDRDVPAVILCREPLTRGGACPVVAVGAMVIRAHVTPPRDPARPDLRWFAAALEALGDVALADASREVDPVRRVDALLARLDAIPEHEKLHQSLAAACAAAALA